MRKTIGWSVPLVLALGCHFSGSAGARPAALTGTLDVTYTCAHEDRHTHTPRYSLAMEGNRVVPLALDEGLLASLGGPGALVGKSVVVEGETIASEFAGSTAPGLRASSLQVQPQARGEAGVSAQLGSKSYLVIPVRFADSRNRTPFPASRINALFRNTAPGLGHYFRTLSYGQMNLDGTRVLDWVNLPRSRAAYRSGRSVNTAAMLEDAVELVDAAVNFPDYYGIILVHNVNPFSGREVGAGGFATRTLDGEHRRYGIVFIGLSQHAEYAHEILHSLSEEGVLPHSSGMYGQTYDSKWDVMSWLDSGPRVNLFGHLAPETIGYHRHLLGWIPEEHRLTVDRGGQAATTLAFLEGKPAPGTHHLVILPISGDGTRFYTVEARRRGGLYDSRIPATSVLIHRVNTRLGDRQAQVVDITRNRNPNDSGAAFLPRETFRDTAAGVSVRIVRATRVGFEVQIVR